MADKNDRNTYGPFTGRDLETAAVGMFDPERLYPNQDGRVILGRLGEPDAWATSGFEDGWVVDHPDGRSEIWPGDQVYDPYDFKALAFVAATHSCPYRPHEDPKEKGERITAAMRRLKDGTS